MYKAQYLLHGEEKQGMYVTGIRTSEKYLVLLIAVLVAYDVLFIIMQSQKHM